MKFHTLLLQFCAFVTKIQGSSQSGWSKPHVEQLDKQEKSHIQEHLKEEGLDSIAPTGEQMAFFYFRLHDNDNNKKLDGLEIMKAVHHTLEHQLKSNTDLENIASDKDTEGRKLWTSVMGGVPVFIDRLLEKEDLDKDGYLDYAEFSRSGQILSVMRSGATRKDT